MDALDVLPMEIWRKISMEDVRVWYVLIRVVGGLSSSLDRHRLKSEGVRVVVHLFDDHSDGEYRSGNVHYDRRYTEYHYLNGLLHSDPGEGPSVVSANDPNDLRDGKCLKIWHRHGRIFREPKYGPSYIGFGGTHLL